LTSDVEELSPPLWLVKLPKEGLLRVQGGRLLIAQCVSIEVPQECSAIHFLDSLLFQLLKLKLLKLFALILLPREERGFQGDLSKLLFLLVNSLES
jgi:hypothetical protein